MIQGGLDFLSGLRLMFSAGSLRGVLWRILGLLLVMMLLVFVGVFNLAEWLASLWLPDGDAWYWQILAWLVHALALLLALLIGAVTFTMLGSVAVAPWLDTLAVRTGRLSGKDLQENTATWSVQILQSISNSIRPLLGLLLGGLLALMLVWIPVIGQLAATLIWGIAGIMFLSYELMDTNASRLGLPFSQRKQKLKQRRFYWLGFGGLAMLLMMVPLVNVLVIPAAVVALSCKDEWQA
ncbi:MAG: hypothetical protein CO186_07890 [Zetaproteobacteria bacterium CG_4_9_14_3_um_filter_49_83]|nr:MAG: hypothetical protein AUJ56_04645 [Zetaproteobacteria bacterium CG1_02_49_23]PIQ33359.1 MAG: hypothetical protein COW62_05570 [Zetaproteobacteria bacterium CG17_big_fil_post_rev_8_21_14_2_50_50_13]PIV31485.1 MAG: hypothetical protein COS35_01155 [Zetaproteobacteria bacterium CG02_land_8_20_14_3_00_50_9]PIY57091.1 MAG: hypothetical protein COZ00_00750 [Zetaproteobacteria bacterium CG_4_10_14_0_8_um_filter_49_80]PJA35057.1 MAG: hypothetical protein CO186_07890 [Zetaproteobacteria bacterium